MKGVFTTKIDPHYDDLPEFRYHFPKTYLKAVEKTLGDWILYYEPRRGNSQASSRGGRQSYFATARVDNIIEDPTLAGHYYALMSDYLEFDKPVPFKVGDSYYESALQKPDGSTNRGAFGRAVRNLSNTEYDLILRSAFETLIGGSVPERAEVRSGSLYNFEETPGEFERPVIERLSKRPFRDAAFSKIIKTVYRDTCAVSGLRICDTEQRPEVQAAHIRPVAEGGPDSVRNGLALSGTVHWMFDRGLIGIDEDYSILIAKEHIPDTVTKRLVNKRGKLLLPTASDSQPHDTYLEYHRRNIFCG